VQRTYPIDFLAEVDTNVYVVDSTGNESAIEGLELDILTKASPSDAWQLSFATTFYGNGQETTPLPFDFSGESGGPFTGTTPMSFNPPPTSTPPEPPALFLASLASYWAHWKTYQGPPVGTIFSDGSFTSGYGEYIDQYPDGSIYNGYPTTFSFSVDTSQPGWEFSAQGGYPVECGGIDSTLTATGGSAGAVVQDPNRSTFGAGLAPGSYASVTYQNLHESCVLANPDGTLAVVGDDGQVFSATGTGA